jgi:arylformamidase
MKIYDVTMPITQDMQVYKNKQSKRPILTSDASINQGDSVNEMRLSINLHTGTHMDFPLHMKKDGLSSDSLLLERLITSVTVLDLTNVDDQISEHHLKRFDIQEGDSILLKTKNSLSESFDHHFIALDLSGAKYLAQHKLNLIGIDGLGIERDQSGHPTHHTLMDANIYILEGLRLKEVAQGRYKMYALPLNTKGTDALLLSVVLIK